MKQLAKLFTEPKVEDSKPKKLYSLRGVATKPSSHFSVTYTIVNTAVEQEQNMDVVEHTTEWWKLSYDTETSSALINKEVSSSGDIHVLTYADADLQRLLLRQRCSGLLQKAIAKFS